MAVSLSMMWTVFSPNITADMRELSLHVLDIVQNSITAGATLVAIGVQEDTGSDSLVIRIEDNGRGMTSEQLQKVQDPFYTTRTTRKVGMGIPLFRMAAQMAGGDLEIASLPGEGTCVTASFGLSHIDRMPLGDMRDTMLTLIRLNPALDFVYTYDRDGAGWQLDTRELRTVLDEVPLDTPEVLEWIREYWEEQSGHAET